MTNMERRRNEGAGKGHGPSVLRDGRSRLRNSNDDRGSNVDRHRGYDRYGIPGGSVYRGLDPVGATREVMYRYPVETTYLVLCYIAVMTTMMMGL